MESQSCFYTTPPSSSQLQNNVYGLKAVITPVKIYNTIGGHQWVLWTPRITCPHGFDDWIVAGVRKVYDGANHILKTEAPNRVYVELGSGKFSEVWVLSGVFKEKKDKYLFDELPKALQLKEFKSANSIVPKDQQAISKKIVSVYPEYTIQDQPSIQAEVNKLSPFLKTSWQEVCCKMASQLCEDKDLNLHLSTMSRIESFPLEKIDSVKLVEYSCIIKQSALRIILEHYGNIEDLTSYGMNLLKERVGRLGIQAVLVFNDIINVVREDLIDSETKDHFTVANLPDFIRKHLLDHEMEISPRSQIIPCSSQDINKKTYSLFKKTSNEVQNRFYENLQAAVIQLLQKGLDEKEESPEMEKAKKVLGFANFVNLLKEKEKIPIETKKASEIYLESITLFSECMRVAKEYAEEAERNAIIGNPPIQLNPNFISFVVNAQYVDFNALPEPEIVEVIEEK